MITTKGLLVRLVVWETHPVPLQVGFVFGGEFTGVVRAGVVGAPMLPVHVVARVLRGHEGLGTAGLGGALGGNRVIIKGLTSLNQRLVPLRSLMRRWKGAIRPSKRVLRVRGTLTNIY